MICGLHLNSSLLEIMEVASFSLDFLLDLYTGLEVV